jgi:hypothetical protein
MISKELLDKVMHIDLLRHDTKYKYVDASGKISDSSIILNYKTSSGALKGYVLNIYELAHKCKKWANNLGFNIITEKVKANGYFSYVVKTDKALEDFGYMQQIEVVNYNPHNKTEPEAIFKACEWILSKQQKDKR